MGLPVASAPSGAQVHLSFLVYTGAEDSNYTAKPASEYITCQYYQHTL